MRVKVFLLVMMAGFLFSCWARAEDAGWSLRDKVLGVQKAAQGKGVRVAFERQSAFFQAREAGVVACLEEGARSGATVRVQVKQGAGLYIVKCEQYD